MKLDPCFSSKSNEWETPQEVFDALNEEFHFTLDPASTDTNAKCRKHYTMKEDGLSKDWKGERVFLNPPYGTEIKKWVKKAWDEFSGGGRTHRSTYPSQDRYLVLA